MKFKLLVFVAFLAIVTCIYASGGDGGREGTSEVGAGESTSVEPVVNINVKHDSKGIGTFTSVTLEPIKPAVAQKGETAFAGKCASCHALTSDRRIGPGLKGITEKRSPEWILNMITNPDENLKKNPLGKALLEEYGSVMPDFGVTDAEALQILEYLRQNDTK